MIIDVSDGRNGVRDGGDHGCVHAITCKQKGFLTISFGTAPSKDRNTHTGVSPSGFLKHETGIRLNEISLAASF